MIRLEGEVDPARVVDLRWAVLRPHQERVASIYPDDGAPGARHWLLIAGEEAVGCASAFVEELDSDHRLRFRGMAVLPEWRGRGLGAQLMKAIQVYAIEWQTGVWCNARTAAGDFYEAMGLSGHGEVFDLPPLGPHRIYRWRP